MTGQAADISWRVAVVNDFYRRPGLELYRTGVRLVPISQFKRDVEMNGIKYNVDHSTEV